jgi:beta-xylosidase
MRYTYFNLVDMVQTRRMAVLVQRFETLEILTDYSTTTGKIFPKEDAYTRGLLKMMLREIFRNKYLGQRLGGSQL